MRCIDGLTLLMMAQHHPRHAVRVLMRSGAAIDYFVHASCAAKYAIEVAIPEYGDPPTRAHQKLCPACHTPVRVALRHDTMQLQFEDPLPCDFWTR